MMIINIIYYNMPLGVYRFCLQLSQKRKEMDSEHGICENEVRQIEFTSTNTFKFTYHYYYEYENTHYVIEDLVSNDTVFSGTFIAEGNRITATINGGQQKSRDKGKRHDKKTAHANISGKILFVEDGNCIKVAEMELSPKLYNQSQMINPGFSFKLSS